MVWKVHDINTAIELLKHASFKGIKEADLELGKIYYQSTEITLNVLLALDYFSHAYQEGILEAGKYIVEISEKDTYEQAKTAFAEVADSLETQIEYTSQTLQNVFDFMEAAFGDSQEMVAFITELNANYYSLWFIRENGSMA